MSRRETRRAYEFVLGVVRHNTRGSRSERSEPSPQPVAIDEAHLLVHVAHSPFAAEQAKTALRAALYNGDLVETGAGYRLAEPDDSEP